MKIALCQINPTVGALQANAHKILNFTELAHKKGAELAVFPELALCGYPPRDLLDKPEFVQKNLEMVKYIQSEAKLPLLFGYVDENTLSVGKPLHNSAALINEKKEKLTYHKTLLPTTDVFDEKRYFESNPQPKTLTFHLQKMGVLICEDSWAGEVYWEKTLYNINPHNILNQENPDFFINISASPFFMGRYQKRIEIFKKDAIQSQKAFIYVNQVGGNDDLIFDGGSFALNKKGKVVAQAKMFEEDLILFDTEKESGEIHDTPQNDLALVYKALCLGLKDYVQKCGFKKVILGLSGGIDSSLVAAIARDALGSDNVVGMMMPSQFNTEASFKDADDLAKNLKIQTHTLSIQEIFDCYNKTLKKVFVKTQFDTTEENLQARIRGNLLMAFSNKYGYLVLATGNKSELAVGYCTLYGDMSGGLSVIGDVPKTLVYKLCHYRNSIPASTEMTGPVIPHNVLTKAPSAELRHHQTDQDSLPPYDVLDGILEAYIVNHLPIPKIIELGYEASVVKSVIKMVDLNEYKRRQAAMTLRITSKAFGTGRRLPVAQAFTQEILK
ncbi:MAG: NAD+ synthase [Deltaproteobacteria bacterium]|nr:NAD+ synthase [Deltaproteobacteria bacterium]